MTRLTLAEASPRYAGRYRLTTPSTILFEPEPDQIGIHTIDYGAASWNRVIWIGLFGAKLLLRLPTVYKGRLAG